MPAADAHGWCFAPPPAGAPPTALILLNSTSPASSPAFLRALWRGAALRVAADGAANRLYDDAGSDAARAALLPDAICGDWDSIAPRVADFYGARGVALRPAPGDQDSTDLVKCLREVARAQAARADGARFRVAVYGAFGGRFDHEAQNLNCLFTWAGRFAALALLSGDTVASLLPAGASRVRVAAPFEGPTCGLVPLAGAAVLTTRGLRWDVAAWPSAFGGSVSTSNHALGEEVEVEASAPVVWTLCVNARAVEAAAAAAAAAAGD